MNAPSGHRLLGALLLIACSESFEDQEARLLGCPAGDRECIERRRRDMATGLDGAQAGPDLAGAADLATPDLATPDLAPNNGPLTLILDRHRISDPCGLLNVASLVTKPADVGLLNCLNPAAGPPPQCQATFPAGTRLELTLSLFGGVRLVSWTGACAAAGSNPTCVITTGGTQRVGYTFAIDGLVIDKTGKTTWNPATNAVSYAASGFPIMVPAACQGAGCCALYASGTKLTLTYGSVTTWGGACSAAGTSKTCTLTVNGRMEVSHSP